MLDPRIVADHARQYRVVLLGGLTGRLDQTAHTLHALHPLLTVRPGIWVVSEYSVACLLNPGENLIDIDHAHLGPTCGLLPLTGATRISTRGLEWDLRACDCGRSKG